MVGGLTHHVKTDACQGIRHLRRGTEAGVVGISVGIVHQNGLLLNAGNVRLFKIVFYVAVNVGKIIGSVVLLGEFIDGTVNQVIAHGHQ